MDSRIGIYFNGVSLSCCPYNHLITKAETVNTTIFSKKDATIFRKMKYVLLMEFLKCLVLKSRIKSSVILFLRKFFLFFKLKLLYFLRNILSNT